MGGKIETGLQNHGKKADVFLHGSRTANAAQKQTPLAVMLSRMKLYAGPSHPHQAQNPEPLALLNAGVAWALRSGPVGL